MRHLDEGMLHAYLDGALDALVEAGALPRGTTRETIETHVGECADCRSLLEAERDVRLRAGEILADAGALPIDVPPFATVQVPVAARKPRSVVPLAWAASVVLALGAGWWGSELFRAQNQMQDTALRDESGQQVQGRPESIELRARPPEADMRAELPSAPPSATSVAAPQRAVDAIVSSEALAERAGRGAAANTSTRAAAEVERLQRDVAADARRDGAIAGNVTRDSTRPVPNPAPVLESLVTTGAQRQLAGAGFGGPAVVSSAQLERFRAGLDSLDAGRVVLTRTTAAALPTQPVIAVEAADTPVIQRGHTLGAGLTRVTQRVGDVNLEIVTWREVLSFADAAQLAPPPALQQQQLQQQAREEARRVETQGASFKATTAMSRFSVLNSSLLPDGRQQVLLHWPDGNTLVAVRADVASEQLLALVNRLTQLRRE